MAVVVIPTKSNIEGVKHLLDTLENRDEVSNVIIVCDGQEAYTRVHQLYSYATVIDVPEGSGIHVMWNRGMEYYNGEHVLFLNDDVTFPGRMIHQLEMWLNANQELGLVCPNYANENIEGPWLQVYDTCRGRYHGGGGMAGFCMMLAADLAKEWRFDERMKWWYGDDDLLRWVTQRGRIGAIVPGVGCTNNSWTINNDPPPHFAEDVENDRIIYETKEAYDA